MPVSAQDRLENLRRGTPNGAWRSTYEPLLSSPTVIRSATLIMLNLPFAVVGGIAAMYFFGIHLSVAAAIGFIAVLGVAVEDALVLVSFCDQLRKKGLKTLDAVYQAIGVGDLGYFF